MFGRRCRRRVERYLRDAAVVAADCGQGADGADAGDQSLLERDALSDGSRADDDADARMATRTLQIDFDFIEHELVFETSDGGRRTIALRPMTVAEFYGRVMTALDALGRRCQIWPHAGGGCGADSV